VAGSPAPGDSAGPAASVAPGTGGTSIPPWDGKDRLNILLIGADEQNGAHNTDTMITVSIDPATNQIVMFTLPRDTVDVPIPPTNVAARNLFGGTYQGKINSWFSVVKGRSDLYADSANTRGYTGLKDILGNLYGLDIKYYVEVNFDGFQKVVDALGGVTVNVQIPVLDDHYPVPASSQHAGGYQQRLYIPAGLQHMSGFQALEYARSRHTSTDFDRGARQQRLLVSLRRQTDIAQVLPSINALTDALKQSIRTDIPRELVPQLLGLAQRIDSHAIRSVIFTPPFYQHEMPELPAARLHHRPERGAHPGCGEGGLHDRPELRGGAECPDGGGRDGLGAQRHDPDGRGIARGGVPRLPRDLSHGAEPETRRHRTLGDHDPDVQRRRRSRSADGGGPAPGVRGRAGCRHGPEGPR